jgi:hypothetical protein
MDYLTISNEEEPRNLRTKEPKKGTRRKEQGTRKNQVPKNQIFSKTKKPRKNQRISITEAPKRFEKQKAFENVSRFDYCDLKLI